MGHRDRLFIARRRPGIITSVPGSFNLRIVAIECMRRFCYYVTTLLRLVDSPRRSHQRGEGAAASILEAMPAT